MKKFILSLSILLASLASAHAKSGFYAGVDAQRQDLQLENSSVGKYYETKSYNPNLFLGFNANKNLDIELGYSMSEEDKGSSDEEIYYITSTPTLFNSNTNTTLKTQNISLDLKPSYQIDQNNSVYGILGLNYVQIKLREIYSLEIFNNYTETDNYKKNILAPTVGFGYKLKINDDFSVRTQFKYSHINKEIGDSDVKLKSLTQLAVGFAYNF